MHLTGTSETSGRLSPSLSGSSLQSSRRSSQASLRNSLPERGLEPEADPSVTTAIEDKNNKCNGNREDACSPRNNCSTATAARNDIAGRQGYKYRRGKNQNAAWINESFSYGPPNGARQVPP